MAIEKVPLNINFQQGLNTKTDPFQIPIGQFLTLENSVFTAGNRLTKRNGFGPLSSLPNVTYEYLTTFQDGLVAVGSELSSLSSSTNGWINKGSFQPITLSAQSAVRSALSQTQCDSAQAPNGLQCTVYTENDNGTSSYKYLIQDSSDGSTVIGSTSIPSGGGTISGSPRVFVLANYFIIVFTNTISAASDLQFIAISTNSPSTIIQSNKTIAAGYTTTSGLSWDGIVVGGQLFIAYNTASGSQQVEIVYVDTLFNVSTSVSFSGQQASLMSMCADTSGTSPVICAAFWNTTPPTSTGYAVAVNTNLQILMTPTAWLSGGSVGNVTSSAGGGIITVFYENLTNYSYNSSLPTNSVSKNTIVMPATETTGLPGSSEIVLRSVGLASKSFIFNSNIYFFAEYSSAYQPTYFLSDQNGNLIARFGYENGGASNSASSPYLGLGLPQAQVVSDMAVFPYLYKDLITSVNKTQGAANPQGVYSQTGVNLGFFQFGASTLSGSEIGNNLNLSGGFLSSYDGSSIVEQGFHLWPDNIQVSTSTSGGNLTAQQYFYQVIYQWTDAQGNIFNSAPSIPVSITTTGSTSTNTIQGPYLRLTAKSNIKIIIYRWSAGQQEYFQVTSLANPIINSTTNDSWSFSDTLSDSSIAGNGLIYTTGSVLENIGGPACTAVTLFDTRLWAIDAEDQNLLWFSKQVIEGTPVEMSDLLTLYIAPNTGTSTSIGPMRCIYPLDDKLIIFKKNAIYYMNGAGPDNTGANSQYSQPIFITSTVGCSNQNSICFIPNGLMFQSDKGIWLLGRDLSTQYIGAPVEAFNSYAVTSALAIPGTTQARFTLNNGMTLMYDYFYEQWGTFTNVNAASSTIYNSLHTYISNSGSVFQETPGLYLDNNAPVLQGFTTGWLKFNYGFIDLMGLQGYQRAYTMFLLGQYQTPHKIQVGVAYDYNSAISQSTIITPTNFSSSVPSAFGEPPAPFGQTGPNYVGDNEANVESWRIFFAKQRCSAIQISLQEVCDPSFGVQSGAGFTLSGIQVIVGMKQSWRTPSAAHSAGGGQNTG